MNSCMAFSASVHPFADEVTLNLHIKSAQLPVPLKVDLNLYKWPWHLMDIDLFGLCGHSTLDVSE